MPCALCSQRSIRLNYGHVIHKFPRNKHSSNVMYNSGEVMEQRVRCILDAH